MKKIKLISIPLSVIILVVFAIIVSSRFQYFDDFKSRASANEKAALTLFGTAKTGDVSATIGALKQLGGTCKSCHDNFKD